NTSNGYWFPIIWTSLCYFLLLSLSLAFSISVYAAFALFLDELFSAGLLKERWVFVMYLTVLIMVTPLLAKRKAKPIAWVLIISAVSLVHFFALGSILVLDVRLDRFLIFMGGGIMAFLWVATAWWLLSLFGCIALLVFGPGWDSKQRRQELPSLLQLAVESTKISKRTISLLAGTGGMISHISQGMIITALVGTWILYQWGNNTGISLVTDGPFFWYSPLIGLIAALFLHILKVVIERDSSSKFRRLLSWFSEVSAALLSYAFSFVFFYFAFPAVGRLVDTIVPTPRHWPWLGALVVACLAGVWAMLVLFDRLAQAESKHDRRAILQLFMVVCWVV